MSKIDTICETLGKVANTLANIHPEAAIDVAQTMVALMRAERDAACGAPRARKARDAGTSRDAGKTGRGQACKPNRKRESKPEHKPAPRANRKMKAEVLPAKRPPGAGLALRPNRPRDLLDGLKDLLNQAGRMATA